MAEHESEILLITIFALQKDFYSTIENKPGNSKHDRDI